MSVILAFCCYMVTFNLSQIIYQYIAEEYKPNAIISTSIISFILHLIIALTLLAHAKDLIFSLFVTYFVIAYFVSDRFLLGKNSDQEKTCAITLMILNSLSLLFMLYKHRLEAFGLVRDQDVEDAIDRMIIHKISSVS